MKNITTTNRRGKALQIIHLEQVANRVDQIVNSTFREQFTQIRQIRPGIKFVVNNKLTSYKQRQMVYEPIQSSRSSIIKTHDQQRRQSNDLTKSSSYLEKKINQLKQELNSMRRTQLLEKSKPIHSIHKMVLFNNLKEIQQDHKLVVVKHKPQSARKGFSIDEINGPMKKAKNFFLNNLAIDNNNTQEPSALSITPEIKQKIKFTPSQQRSVSQGLITQQRRPIRGFQQDLIDFKGWDVEDEDDYLRLG